MNLSLDLAEGQSGSVVYGHPWPHLPACLR